MAFVGKFCVPSGIKDFGMCSGGNNVKIVACFLIFSGKSLMEAGLQRVRSRLQTFGSCSHEITTLQPRAPIFKVPQ